MRVAGMTGGAVDVAMGRAAQGGFIHIEGNISSLAVDLGEFGVTMAGKTTLLIEGLGATGWPEEEQAPDNRCN